MKLALCSASLLFGCSLVAQASPLVDCTTNAQSANCQSYLSGVIDGALIYRTDATARTLPADDYQSRALKFRTGKRYKAANRAFCAEQQPNKPVLLEVLTDNFASGDISDASSLQLLVRELLTCQQIN